MSPKLQQILGEAQLEMRGDARAFSDIVEQKIHARPPDERDALLRELELLKGVEEPERPKYEN